MLGRSLLFMCLTTHVLADKLNVAYQWKTVEFEFPSEDLKQQALLSKKYIPENQLPLGVEVYDDRIFVTLPRWKYGVAASLGYIDRKNDPMDSPKLKPYPNWTAHALYGGVPEIVSPFRIRADQCHKLWVLDTGYEGSLEEEDRPGGRYMKNSSLLIYDLSNDALLRSYTIPSDQLTEDSLLANIAVEDEDCDNSFAYMADLGGPGLIVYSWKENRSWKVQHNFFHIDPLAGDMTVASVSFQWTDGIFGLALRPEKDGYSTLFFHPMTSFNEFSVSTKILRDEQKAKDPNNYFEYKNLGSRGPKGQSGTAFLDKKTGVLFYALIHLNAIACWRTTNPAYTMESQGRIYMNNVTMVFPNDVKVDKEGNLWVLSDRLPTFIYSLLDRDDYNYRIMTAKVSDAIKGTACASKLNPDPDIMNKIAPALVGGDKIKPRNSGAGSVGINMLMLVIAIALEMMR
ncbi:L-dopachrome tautomerase yellow-b [Rhynchophorus ferrugineus]|uniref:L-dopachrome tautomerase yellow-b n=1 Tax=Rhynchophorus ferrugineus TaxID=354439 RepID=UPI003FCD6189